MLHKCLILLAVSLSASLAVFAQGTEGRFGGSENAPVGTEAAPGVNERRPILLSGNVVLSSGQPLVEPILIKRICGTRIIPEAYTDSKGHFLFEIGGTAAMAVMDSSSQGLGESQGSGSAGSSFGGLGKGDTTTTGIDFTGCTVVADAPGFRSQPIALGRRRSLDQSDIGTFILTPIAGAQAVTVSATSMAAPKKARSAYEKALKELQKGESAKVDKAITDLEQAVGLHPEYAAAWTALGQAKLQMGDAVSAKSALEKAIAADSRYLRPYAPLARITISEQDWERTRDLTAVVLSVDDSDSQMKWFHAVSLFELREMDDAVTSLSQLLSDEAAEQRFPQSHHLLGMIYASRGEIKEAATEYLRYIELAPDADASVSVKQQLEDWRRQGNI
jgi:Tfp pilus assembly protein PilF